MSMIARGIVTTLCGSLLAASPNAEGQTVCAPFCDGLESAAAVAANGGLILGPVGFVPAIHGQGAQMGPPASIRYQGGYFAAARGSISMWFRKTSTIAFGGLAQIGVIGQPNSVGLFFDQTSRLVYEARNAAGGVGAVSAEGVLTETAWTHVVATWDHRSEGTDLWLFLDGRFHQHTYLPGALVATSTQLEIGSTGYYGGGEGLFDELRFFDWNLADSEVYAEYVLSSDRHRKQPATKPVSSGPVQLIDGNLFVEGRPFRVKGVGYQPTPVGWPISRAVLDVIYSDSAILTRDMALLRSMNVNTIRLWSEAPNTALLDACYSGGLDPIYVVMGYWVPLGAGVDYGAPDTRAAIEAGFRAYVSRFKDHPAVLAWGIGNENNLNYFGPMRDWYSLANQLAAAAYAEEGASYHPTVLVNGGFGNLGDVDCGSDDVAMGMLDVWGANLYFGYDAHAHFDYYAALSAKPLLLTEYGIDAWDNRAGAEYQAVQADYVRQQWRQIQARTLGGTVMAYSDEWWKAGAPQTHDFGGYGTGVHVHPDGFSNEEWWGMVAVADAGGAPDILSPRAAYFALADEYADRTGDYDLDDDSDLADFAAFQRCVGSSLPACVSAFDFVASGGIDGEDYAAFAACLGGSNRPPACPP